MTTINEKVKQRLLKSDEEALKLYDLIDASPMDVFNDNGFIGQDGYAFPDSNEKLIFLAHQAQNSLLIQHMWGNSEKDLAIYFTSEDPSKYLKKICENTSVSKNPINILSYSLLKIKNLFSAPEFDKLKQELIFILLGLPVYGWITDLYGKEIITQNDLLVFSKINKNISGDILAILNNQEDIMSFYTINKMFDDIENIYREDLSFAKRGISVNTQKKLSILNVLLRNRTKSKNKENIGDKRYLLMLEVAQYYQSYDILSETRNNMFIDKFDFYMSLTRENKTIKVKERI